ncbi:axin-2 isoform X1 [Alosa sapidissima]|uniref:axin-2 isoform X1 n=1 Tax=Alosa sapidissima TaxID=34773 RepID=UPI001C0806A7|nr:axin-2 isoform X1 [Alosa sapidissima]
MSRALADPIATSFREDAPRPPVPGEEGETKCYNPCKLAVMRLKDTVKSAVKVAPPGSAARRDEDGLGEPEGSASPDSPLARWTKSLLSLLGDQDGAQLFRTFLEREKCVDTLDFWFACNGFRQMDLKDTKTHRVAKAIYKRYIENHSVVAKQLKPATKTFIRDSVKRQQIDSSMFDQAQTEIQTAMEENAYQMFLTSDIYLDYVRSGCENAAHGSPDGLGSLKLVCGYLPTLNEEEEWSCSDFKAKALASMVGLSAKALRAAPSVRAVEALERGYRSYRRGESASPFHISTGLAFAPASSANDSEISSDAMTDDSMSLADSVDGVCVQQLGSRKHLQREMQRSMRINGQVSLPHFPQKGRRPPREMGPVEPAEFAAQLTARLERLKREQDSMSFLEERLQQIQEEEERDDTEASCGMSSLSPHPLSLPSTSSCDEDAQAILDEHLSRVLKTPGCQSPPRSRSPDRHHRSPLARAKLPFSSSPAGPPFGCYALSPAGGTSGGPSPHHHHHHHQTTFVSRQSTRHIHHHIHHHHAGGSAGAGPGAASPRSREQLEAEAARRVQGLCRGAPGGLVPRSRSLGREQQGEGSPTTELPLGHSGILSQRLWKSGEEVSSESSEADGIQLPTDTTDRSQNVWQWIMESGRQPRHKTNGVAQGAKRWHGAEPSSSSTSRTPTWGGGGSSGHLRAHQPAHPFVQDPAMPPLPPPNTLAQLEEACRRLEEVSKPPKQRHSPSSVQRERGPGATVQNGPSSQLGLGLQTDEPKEVRKQASGQGSPGGAETVVTYFFCGEEIPYRRVMKTHSLTLGHFKEQLRKKGNYRYYFKKASDEFECGAVFEEVWEDASVLPMYEGKVLGKVERMD